MRRGKPWQCCPQKRGKSEPLSHAGHCSSAAPTSFFNPHNTTEQKTPVFHIYCYLEKLSNCSISQSLWVQEELDWTPGLSDWGSLGCHLVMAPVLVSFLDSPILIKWCLCPIPQQSSLLIGWAGSTKMVISEHGPHPFLVIQVNSDIISWGLCPTQVWNQYLRGGQPMAFSGHVMQGLVSHIQACWVLPGFSPDNSGIQIMGYQTLSSPYLRL